MPDLPTLSIEMIWAILNQEIDDATVNQLLCHCLGYRWNAAIGQWDNSQVAAEWRQEYPEPPDFIGSRPATVKLTRSIPKANKQILKEKLGFEGYKINELNPTLTRRATAANWLLSYLENHTSSPS